MAFIRINSILFFLCVVCFACDAPQQYSVVPQISIIKSEFYRTFSETAGVEVKKVDITIEVIDGDGDIGSQELNNIDSAHFDVVMGFNPYVNGVLLLGTELGYKDETYRIPNTQAYNKNEYLKADIALTREYPSVLFSYDSVQFYVQIYDLAGHESNLACTDMLIVR